MDPMVVNILSKMKSGQAEFSQAIQALRELYPNSGWNREGRVMKHAS